MPKIYLRDFSGGLNKKMPPHLIQNNQCSDLSDCVYRNGQWAKKPGSVHRTATGNGDAILEYVDVMNTSGSINEVAASNKNIYYWNGSTWTTRFTTGATRASTDKWWFAEFFNKSYACNGKDGIIRTTDPSSTNYTTFSWGDMVINQAKVILTMNQRLFFFNTNDATNGVNVNRVIYSNVVTSPTGGETTIPSGNWLPVDFSNSPIQAAAVLPNRMIAIWSETDVSTLVDTGANPAFVIKFARPQGIIAPKAFCEHPRGYFYISQDGFYIFTGGSIVPVGDEVITNYFFSNVSNNRANTYCWNDREHSEIHILYSTSPEEPNRHLVWNYLYDIWSEFLSPSAFCGTYLYRQKAVPKSVYGKSAGIVADRTGSLENGSTITPRLKTKAFLGNVDIYNEFKDLPYDYIQTGIVQTDARPVTTYIDNEGADYGSGTYSTESSQQLSTIAGDSPRADIYGQAHYQRWHVHGFDTVSELIISYQGEQIE